MHYFISMNIKINKIVYYKHHNDYFLSFSSLSILFHLLFRVLQERKIDGNKLKIKEMAKMNMLGDSEMMEWRVRKMHLMLRTIFSIYNTIKIQEENNKNMRMIWVSVSL